jgi:hypothetical protein
MSAPVADSLWRCLGSSLVRLELKCVRLQEERGQVYDAFANLGRPCPSLTHLDLSVGQAGLLGWRSRKHAATAPPPSCFRLPDDLMPAPQITHHVTLLLFNRRATPCSARGRCPRSSCRPCLRASRP